MSDRRRLASVLAIAGGMFLTVAVQAQTTWYVDHGNCPGPGTGSERDPFCKIQDGIDASSIGDTVIVADGTYTGNGNRDLDFGGRDIHLRSESLDPELCIINCQGSPANPHRGFNFHSGETLDATIEGLTIRNGFRALNCDSGGAIFVVGGSALTVDNCVFESNTACEGGGILVADGNEILVINSTISGNTAVRDGGGILCPGTLTLINSVISGNESTGDAHTSGSGGGVFCRDGLISACMISDNHIVQGLGGSVGGGISCDGVAVIADSLITGNSITQTPGNFGVQGGGISVGSNALAVNCTITGNWVTGAGARGGGATTNGLMVGCTVFDNAAQAGGGGILTDLAATVVNCLVVGNSTDGFGGGVSAISDGSRIVNCSIVANTAAQAGGGVAALGWVGTSLTIDNSIVWNNSANNGPQLAVVTHETGAPATLNVNFNDPQGGQADVFVDTNSTLNWGPGNIDVDPLFVDADGPDDDPDTWEDNDYRLQADSPCIDAGDNEAVPPDSADLDDDGDTDEPTPFDLDGYARFVDGDGDEQADVDMGAYEFQTHGPCPWDLNGDGGVGPFDLAVVLGNWGPCKGCPADLDGNGQVGPFDLALLLGNWGPCK